MTVEVRCVLMRGGTSKAVFLREEDLPTVGAERDRLITRLFGSPDSRQIDGLGGADPLTSKLAIISGAPVHLPGNRRADISYTFGQVEITRDYVDYHSLCGNITAAVGNYAVHEGLVRPDHDLARIHVFNTNLSRILTVEVPVADGRPVEDGDYEIPGVPGSGARIAIDFSDTAGAATGNLLPTGNAVDRLEVAGVGEIEASLIDIGNAHVFIRAADIGLTGTESAAEIDTNMHLRKRLEAIRSEAAFRMGMVEDAASATLRTPATPILGIVSPPRDYVAALTGKTVLASDIDLVSRLMFMQQCHKTYAGTSTACTGVAAFIPETIVHEMVPGNGPCEAEVRIGHPAGIIDTEAVVVHTTDGWEVRRATLNRTARRLMEGRAFLPRRPS